MLYDTSNTLLPVSGRIESRKQDGSIKKRTLCLVCECETQLLHTTKHVAKQRVIYSFTTPTSICECLWCHLGQTDDLRMRRNFEHEVSAKQRKGTLDSPRDTSLPPLPPAPLFLSLSVCPSARPCLCLSHLANTYAHTHTHTHTQFLSLSLSLSVCLAEQTTGKTIFTCMSYMRKTCKAWI